MKLNKVLSVKDYVHFGATRRKQWEVGMALTALQTVVTGESEVLGVGAGIETTIFYLSALAKRVFATDLYYAPGEWNSQCPPDMLTDPAKYAPMGVIYDARRIITQHMDGCDLRYPDSSFDGVFSSGSIEHFGSFANVQRAAREIGRVLKPGGVCALATEFKIEGAGDGWHNTLVFTPEGLQQHIIEPSGLVLVDEPDWTVDADTLATRWSLTEAVHGRFPPVEGVLWSDQGYLFTSVHLTLRKPLSAPPEPIPAANAPGYTSL